MSSTKRHWTICADAPWQEPSFISWPRTDRRGSPIRPPGEHISTALTSRQCRSPNPICIATEGALWGIIQAHGLLREMVIVSDDAGQFAGGQHALCWVHAGRLVHKLDSFTDLHRTAQQRMRALIWRFYDDLKAYRAKPTARRRGELRARFDRIFHRRTGFVTLDRLLVRLHAKKPELLMVLDRPEIPLHTNGSERDIRLHVTKCKVSGGTRSLAGRDYRDAFLGLMRTAAKLGFAFWHYLGDRLTIPCRSPTHPWPADRALSARPCPLSAPTRLNAKRHRFCPCYMPNGIRPWR